LKPASNFSQVGKVRTRLDTAAKINGAAAYGIDQRFPNMLFGVLAQCPVDDADVGNDLNCVA